MDALMTTRTPLAPATRRAAARVDLEALAHAVAGDGFDLHLGRVLGLVLEARDLGGDQDLVDGLADDLAPATVRERALGLVAVRVEAARRPVRDYADILSA